jgi:hypothetical protein
MDDQTITRIVNALDKCATYINDETNALIDSNAEANMMKDKLSYFEAEAFITSTLQMNDNGDKLKYPNIKAQESAALISVESNFKYTEAREVYRAQSMSIEKTKARITRLHEKRRDLNVEVELLKVMQG